MKRRAHACTDVAHADGRHRGGGGGALAFELEFVARLYQRWQAEAVITVVVSDAHGLHLRRVQPDVRQLR